ncbi:MAG: glycoside hydrolase family 3 C-terminal domain-containing protein [Bifidobacteriaceae bacterium]|jgi:beta-glucosidase|nr:glycoside hydrolase family 3 C-terminal domain-containing protein [Bifidobacteriaceae bacterium]
MMNPTIETATAQPLSLADVDRLTASMTDQEKLSLLDGLDFWHTQPLPRIGLRPLLVTDGPHGLRKQVADRDQIGLGSSVPATCFPPAAGLASSWDPALAGQIGQAIGQEARAQQVDVVLGPGLNIKRSPLGGRNFEYFSEDPLLSGEMAAAMAAGIQSRGIGACLKHFVANNQETDRMRVSAEIPERALREIYLAGFERAVKASRPWTVMASYNKVNGVYVGSSERLLTDVLRGEWGFDGLVMSDWGAVDRRPEALAAGLDLEMPTSSGEGAAAIRRALGRGQLSMADADRSVRRLVTLAARVGQATAPGQSFDAAAHHALARQAAERAAVLLKNDADLLPLDAGQGGPIAIIGEFARTPRYQGAGSSAVNPTLLENALDAIGELVGGRREIRFAPGFLIDATPNGAARTVPAATLEAGLPAAMGPGPIAAGTGGEKAARTASATREDLAAEAARTASTSEVAVVFLGLPASWETEGADRTSLSLPPAQIELLEQVAAVQPNTVVVLAGGGAVDVGAWDPWAGAVLDVWLGGQAGGSAVARLLFGLANPSGKLAETIPLRLEDTPAFGNFPGERGQVVYGEGVAVGYRWYDGRGADVAYPFGHGLSYTSFEYSQARAEVLEDGAEPAVAVRVTVRNTGGRAGREVVQVYVHDPDASVWRPEQELRAFASVELEPGEAREVAWVLDGRSFSFWDVALGRWFVEGGRFEIRFAASSRDIRARTPVELRGETLARPLTVESTVEEWLADPSRGPWLRARLATSSYADLLEDSTARELMGSAPLERLTRFPGFPVTPGEAQTQVLR